MSDWNFKEKNNHEVLCNTDRPELPNSTRTVAGNCCSAGRLYDKIGDTAVAKVKYILENAVVCKVKVSPVNQPAETDEDDIEF